MTTTDTDTRIAALESKFGELADGLRALELQSGGDAVSAANSLFIGSDGTTEGHTGSGESGGGGKESSGGGSTTIGPAESIEALNAAFPSGPPNEQVGLIRVGAGADQEDIELVYDAARKKWVGPERIIMRNTDQNGPTIGFYALVQLGRSFETGLGTGAWWNFASPPHLNLAMAAGLAIEYRQEGYVIADSSGALVNVGALIYQLNDADANPDIFGQPIEGGWAQTDFLSGGGLHSVSDYEWLSSDWATLKAVGGGALAPASKSSLYPVLVGQAHHIEPGEPLGNAAIIDYLLAMRFVG